MRTPRNTYGTISVRKEKYLWAPLHEMIYDAFGNLDIANNFLIKVIDSNTKH